MKEIRKNIICSFIFTVMIFLTTSLSVLKADVIFTPNDSFWEKNSDECEYNNRLYIANGPDGTVTVYKSPESKKEMFTVKNGKEEYVSYTYEDANGNEWGYVEDLEFEKAGWLPIAYMEVVYDEVSFEEDFSDSIDNSEGKLKIDKTQVIKFWQYPGSKLSDDAEVVEEDLLHYEKSYSDQEGRKWICIDYYQGIRNSWICVEQKDATYEELFKNGEIVKQGEDTQTKLALDSTEVNTPPTQRIEPDDSASKQTVVFVIAGVGVVAAVSIILLMVLKKKNR